MAYAKPNFSRNQVDKAGFILTDPNTTWENELWALQVINNWRASHNFPLNNFQTSLRFKGKHVQPDVLVAQRIKRLESIKAKLVRDQTSTLQLSQMQDIGGCRAILKNSQAVAALVKSFKTSRFNHKLNRNETTFHFRKLTAIGATISFINIKAPQIKMTRTTSFVSRFRLERHFSMLGLPQ